MNEKCRAFIVSLAKRDFGMAVDTLVTLGYDYKTAVLLLKTEATLAKAKRFLERNPRLVRI